MRSTEMILKINSNLAQKIVSDSFLAIYKIYQLLTYQKVKQESLYLPLETPN